MRKISRVDFWRAVTIDQLTIEQDIAVPQPIEVMMGAAAHLWDDEGDFDRFVRGIRDRHGKRRA